MSSANGKSRKKVTFKLVSASYSDPRAAENPAQRTLVLKSSQNDVWKKRDKTTVPKEFLSLINPADFGIHAGLPESQKDELIMEIYGTREEYERIAARFTHVDAPKKPKEEELDDDCYFPKDGYDYSQHLATITPQNFIPAVKPMAEDSDKLANVKSLTDFPSLKAPIPAPTTEDQELAEVLKALDDEASDEEVMDDDFVAKAMDNEDPDTFVDENELLWGGCKPLRRAMYEANELFGATVDEYERSRNLAADFTPDPEDAYDDAYENTYDDAGTDDDELGQDAMKDDEMPSSLMELLKNNEWKTEEYEKDTMDALDPVGDMKGSVLNLVEQAGESDSAYSVEEEYYSDSSEQWDVETVLTKYTNATNHPQRIRANVVQKIKQLEKKSEAPTEPKEKEDIEYVELPPIVTTRNRNETPEERKARKAAVKQAKAIITKMKKQNKESLKDAKKKAVEKDSRGSYDIVNGVKYIKLK